MSLIKAFQKIHVEPPLVLSIGNHRLYPEEGSAPDEVAMRDYAKVSPRFWLGETGRELRKAGAEAQVVAFYLMTSPHANMLGDAPRDKRTYFREINYIAAAFQYQKKNYKSA
ncbi:hypothetical protein K9T61_05110 [Escherichia coli]|nr:hypothetical protein [Escherichia coli]